MRVFLVNGFWPFSGWVICSFQISHFDSALSTPLFFLFSHIQPSSFAGKIDIMTHATRFGVSVLFSFCASIDLQFIDKNGFFGHNVDFGFSLFGVVCVLC